MRRMMMLFVLATGCAFESGGLVDLLEPTLYASKRCPHEDAQDMTIGQEEGLMLWTCVVGELDEDVSETVCWSADDEATFRTTCGRSPISADVGKCRLYVECKRGFGQ